jgi:6-phosphogluconolactonase (cycloisomerase 2 family)
VYAATNEPTGDRIQVFARAADGTLTPGAAVPTGGAGSGGFEGSANGLILASRGGESSPNNLTGGPDRLLATNTGSSSVSVFRTTGPRARASKRADGRTRSPQVSFNPSGDTLVVTEKQENVIDTYRVGRDGLADGPIVNSTGSNGPFGSTFTQTGKLLTADNFGGVALQGAASSYDIERDSTLTLVTLNVRNMRSDTCWLVLTDNGKFAYVTNAMSNDISSYQVRPDDSMTLLESIAGPADELPAPFAIPADLGLSGDSRYLYVRNVRDGDLFACSVRADGTLVPIQSLPRALPPSHRSGGQVGRQEAVRQNPR